MKKIMILAISALLLTGVTGSAFARDNYIGRGGGHGGHGFHSGGHANYRHYGNYHRGNYSGGGYGYDDDDSIAPFIAGGVFGAILGNAFNR